MKDIPSHLSLYDPAVLATQEAGILRCDFNIPENRRQRKDLELKRMAHQDNLLQYMFGLERWQAKEAALCYNAFLTQFRSHNPYVAENHLSDYHSHLSHRSGLSYERSLRSIITLELFAQLSLVERNISEAIEYQSEQMRFVYKLKKGRLDKIMEFRTKVLCSTYFPQASILFDNFWENLASELTQYYTMLFPILYRHGGEVRDRVRIPRTKKQKVE